MRLVVHICRATFLIASGLKATLTVFLQSRKLQVKAELASNVCGRIQGNESLDRPI